MADAVATSTFAISLPIFSEEQSFDGKQPVNFSTLVKTLHEKEPKPFDGSMG